MSWDDFFKQGIDLFRQNNYEEALNKFNEVRGHLHRETESGFTRVKQAISKNSKEKSVYDSRAAVFEKLDRPEDALKDSKKVIDLAPGSWQGYARSARLFLQIKNPEASLNMAELALERLNGSDEERRFEFDALKQQALKDLGSPPYFFSKLAVETCGEIFALVANESSADMLALTHVCRGWREIILNMPSLWQRLVLTQRTSDEKVDAWLQRSKGTLTSLEIRRGFDFDAQPNIWRYASECFWAKLRSLKVHLPREIKSLSQVFSSDALSQLQLQALEVNFSEERALWFNENSFGNLDLTRLSSLVLWNADWIMAPWKCLLPCTALTTLDIQKCTIVPNDVLPVLAQNPLLETFNLVSIDVFAPETVDIPEPIELVHLRHLCLFAPRSTNVYFRCLRFPNLEELTMISAGSVDEDRRYLDVLMEQSLPNLTYLRFGACGLEHPDVLITFLQSSLKLRCFVFQGCLEAEAVNTILTALAEPAPSSLSQEGSKINERPICCPSLQHLNLMKSVHLQAEPVLRLVKARLPPADVASEGDSGSDLPSASTGIVPPSLQLPIQTLILDDCEAFDTSALPWLRANVPRVSFKMTPQVKEAKEAYYSRYTFWM